MIKNRDPENILNPMFRLQVTVLASNKNCTKWSQAVFATMPDVRIHLSNDSECRWNAE